MKNNFKKLLYKQVFLCNPQKKKSFQNKKPKAQKEMELIFWNNVVAKIME
jgi:hypothetical protein